MVWIIQYASNFTQSEAYFIIEPPNEWDGANNTSDAVIDVIHGPLEILADFVFEEQVLAEHDNWEDELQVEREGADEEDLIKELELTLGDVDSPLIVSHSVDKRHVVGHKSWVSMFDVQVLNNPQEEVQA